jgi:2'-5' RNA ligase
MGGRFGKYGDLKRRKALQRGRKQKAKLAKAASISLRSRGRPMPSVKTALHLTAPKTHKTAVVIIPPGDLWKPIQALRQQYDRHFLRWMPHITLLYPFRPSASFHQVTPLLARACRLIKPFEVQLRRFNFFKHARQNATCYLAPEPAGPLIALHQMLLSTVPDCDDVARFAGGFVPHLSLGQTRSQNVAALCDQWQASWQPLSFTLEQVHVIWRNDPPDDIFRVGPILSMGKPADK